MRRLLAVAAVVLSLIAALALATFSSSPRARHYGLTVSSNGTPVLSGTPVCGVASLLDGPAAAPAGAVTVAAGDNSTTTLNTPSTTYYFASGTHTLGATLYSQIIAGAGDTYIGAPGAIISGQGINAFAFTQTAANVTIEYLTITGFLAADDQGVVNHDSGSGGRSPTTPSRTPRQAPGSCSGRTR